MSSGKEVEGAGSVISIIAEEQLIESLPEAWQARFRELLTLMLQDIGSPLQWENLASRCHISPSRFHQVFLDVFHETPGKFLTRQRLKLAVYLFSAESDLSVTEIAYEVGFSSSQALAKAIKRELGVSATQLREKARSSDHAFFDALVRKLGQPSSSEGEKSSVVEEDIAEQLAMRIETRDPGHYFFKTVDASSVDRIYREWTQIARDKPSTMMMASDWRSVAENPEDSLCQVGYACPASIANHVSPAGRYMTCTARIQSMSSYYLVWSRLYWHVLAQEVEPAPDAPVYESYHTPHRFYEDASEITFSVYLGALEADDQL